MSEDDLIMPSSMRLSVIEVPVVGLPRPWVWLGGAMMCALVAVVSGGLTAAALSALLLPDRLAGGITTFAAAFFLGSRLSLMMLSAEPSQPNEST